MARLYWMTSHPRSATNSATQPAISGIIPGTEMIPGRDICEGSVSIARMFGNCGIFPFVEWGTQGQRLKPAQPTHI